MNNAASVRVLSLDPLSGHLNCLSLQLERVLIVVVPNQSLVFVFIAGTVLARGSPVTRIIILVLEAVELHYDVIAPVLLSTNLLRAVDRPHITEHHQVVRHNRPPVAARVTLLQRHRELIPVKDNRTNLARVEEKKTNHRCKQQEAVNGEVTVLEVEELGAVADYDPD